MKIDKMKYSPVGEYSLMIQGSIQIDMYYQIALATLCLYSIFCSLFLVSFVKDDGGGMSPEYLRRCLSFGFSNKCTNSSIGQCNCFCELTVYLMPLLNSY